MSEITTIGLDLAKNVFQAHGADALGRLVLRRKLRRDQVLAFFSQLPPCVVAMEACGGAHFWGREIGKLGHEVRLIPPAYVKPFVKRQKNDVADAEAICGAALRPTMRFVPVKSEETQGAAMVFRVRELLIRQRTQAINALRGHLAEFGQIVPQGAANAARLIAIVENQDSDLPADAIATLGTVAKTGKRRRKPDRRVQAAALVSCAWLCRECGGNCRAAGSGHVTMAPVRPRGQGTSARAAEKEFPSRQPSASGSALKVSIAADYGRKNDKGEWEGRPYWNTVTLFNENIVKWAKDNLGQGDLVHARGTIRETSYDKDGETRYGVTLAADQFDRLVAKERT